MLILIIIVLLLVFWYCSPEAFISKRAYALHNAAFKFFKDTDSYSKFKKIVPSADPVLYHDLRQMATNGKLSPSGVQRYL